MKTIKENKFMLFILFALILLVAYLIRIFSIPLDDLVIMSIFSILGTVIIAGFVYGIIYYSKVREKAKNNY